MKTLLVGLAAAILLSGCAVVREIEDVTGVEILDSPYANFVSERGRSGVARMIDAYARSKPSDEDRCANLAAINAQTSRANLDFLKIEGRPVPECRGE